MCGVFLCVWGGACFRLSASRQITEVFCSHLCRHGLMSCVLCCQLDSLLVCPVAFATIIVWLIFFLEGGHDCGSIGVRTMPSLAPTWCAWCCRLLIFLELYFCFALELFFFSPHREGFPPGGNSPRGGIPPPGVRKCILPLPHREGIPPLGERNCISLYFRRYFLFVYLSVALSGA